MARRMQRWPRGKECPRACSSSRKDPVVATARSKTFATAVPRAPFHRRESPRTMFSAAMRACLLAGPRQGHRLRLARERTPGRHRVPHGRRSTARWCADGRRPRCSRVRRRQFPTPGRAWCRGARRWTGSPDRRAASLPDASATERPSPSRVNLLHAVAQVQADALVAQMMVHRSGHLESRPRSSPGPALPPP